MNNKQEIPKSTDVLVVGAGPTGMTLAISLKQLGLDCVVIDQLPGPPDDARAAFVQPRTLEYLGRIQVADPLIDDGLKGRGAAFADLERDLVRLSYETVDSPYPFLLMIPQSQTQRHLDQRFALGGSVLRGVACWISYRNSPEALPPWWIPPERCEPSMPASLPAATACTRACAINWASDSPAAHRRRCSRCLT
jgi:FAD binding domain